MSGIIHGVKVTVDSKLPKEKVANLVGEEVQAWIWEGKTLEKMELVMGDDCIVMYSYEKSSPKRIPLETIAVNPNISARP
jgi:hypothetical protein